MEHFPQRSRRSFSLTNRPFSTSMIVAGRVLACPLVQELLAKNQADWRITLAGSQWAFRMNHVKRYGFMSTGTTHANSVCDSCAENNNITAATCTLTGPHLTGGEDYNRQRSDEGPSICLHLAITKACRLQMSSKTGQKLDRSDVFPRWFGCSDHVASHAFMCLLTALRLLGMKQEFSNLKRSLACDVFPGPDWAHIESTTVAPSVDPKRPISKGPGLVLATRKITEDMSARGIELRMADMSPGKFPWKITVRTGVSHRFSTSTSSDRSEVGISCRVAEVDTRPEPHTELGRHDLPRPSSTRVSGFVTVQMQLFVNNYRRSRMGRNEGSTMRSQGFVVAGLLDSGCGPKGRMQPASSINKESWPLLETPEPNKVIRNPNRGDPRNELDPALHESICLFSVEALMNLAL